MSKLTLAAASLSLALCFAAPAGATLSPAAGGGVCNATRAQGMVGKPLMNGSIDAAKRRSGASVGRVMRMGRIYTMEFRADRVNLETNQLDVIIGVRCG